MSEPGGVRPDLAQRLALVHARRRHRCYRVPCWTCDQLDRELQLIQSELEQLLARTVDTTPAHIVLHAS